MSRLLVLSLFISITTMAQHEPQYFETPENDIQMRFYPWDDAAPDGMRIGHYKILVDNETSFVLGAKPQARLHEYLGLLGNRYLLREGVNRIDYTPVSPTGVEGPTETAMINKLPPVPPPDPVPVSFKVIGVEARDPSEGGE